MGTIRQEKGLLGFHADVLRGIIVSCQTAMKRGRCVRHSLVVPYLSLNTPVTLFELPGIS